MQGQLSEVVLILVGSTLIILLLIGLIVIALFINQKRKFKYRQQLFDIKYQNEKEILRIQLETQAQTFETISQELHDNVGTIMSIAIVHSKVAAAALPENKNLAESGRLLEEGLEILRDISRSINPDNISRNGLVKSFKNELARIQKTKIFKTEFKVDGTEVAIQAQHQMVLFRIVQESLNNIMKHSGGNLVTLDVVFDPRSLRIVIRDNGKGFNLGETSVSMNGSGLQNMIKRAKIIEATLDIESAPDQGTKVSLFYPLSKTP